MFLRFLEPFDLCFLHGGPLREDRYPFPSRRMQWDEPSSCRTSRRWEDRCANQYLRSLVEGFRIPSRCKNRQSGHDQRRRQGLATKLVADIAGAKSVNNLMTIKSSKTTYWRGRLFGGDCLPRHRFSFPESVQLCTASRLVRGHTGTVVRPMP